MSQNEKKNKENKEKENQLYSHLNKIYKEINEQGEIYTEGFTPEQIYYQIEEVSEKIYKEANERIKMVSEVRKDKLKADGHEKAEGKVEDKAEGKLKEADENASEDDQEDVSEDDYGNEDNETDNEDDSTPLVIENVGSDYSDCSSVDEGTYSEDSSPFDPEEMKSKPASELFKTLDKNIRRK
ncbi:hypothetical protein NBO_30g0006 [Nosema bombycis CQ1]|uniref:Uncharacterized protein n=1 Tax=Nosema bombycis (strain CQ1 / CVCC 102059) TaxID=578461 RepID=R0KVT2_NOSB1|nr:hypothetical protein NBO_30g0006 [Nosema bombycis CQ1]|eukprot:EOB14312.1 hypothetical protein NBO_30g0006 [Nosema bombycis CQ1]